MRIPSIAFSILSILSLFTGCDRGSDPAPEPVKEEIMEETKHAAQTETTPPALTEAAIESLIFDALSPTGDEVAAVDDTKFSLNNLTEAQRKTLNEAVSKAVTKIDFKTLLTSIASNLNVKGLDLNGLPGNMQVSTRVLTPEEAEKMGIHIKNSNAKDAETGESGSSPISIGNVSIISVGSGENIPLLRTNSENGGPEANTGVTIEKISAMEVTEDSDPERAERFQSLLESGDSDALAGEIADLIQSGIDSATLQQALGGGAPSSPKK